MDLKSVISNIQKLYPTKLAEKWDNTGLLLEPSTPKSIQKILLTIDLTEKVLEEAIEKKADMILSYHPPIFSAFKRLNISNTKDRIVIRSIEERIAIYSPHTSVDSSAGGVNDWLADGLGEASNVRVLQPFSEVNDAESTKIALYVPEDKSFSDDLVSALNASGFPTKTFSLSATQHQEKSKSANLKIEIVCSKSKVRSVADVVEEYYSEQSLDSPSLEVYNIEGTPVKNTGQGRVVTLKEKIPLSELVVRIKKHLGLERIRIAYGDNKNKDTMVQTIAMCAGSGGEVVGKTRADVFWTGEMGHHPVLEAVSKGTTVILCEHSNTERGYLRVLKEKLGGLVKGVQIDISEKDADPLVVV